jgi:hypothetical protein
LKLLATFSINSLIFAGVQYPCDCVTNFVDNSGKRMSFHQSASLLMNTINILLLTSITYKHVFPSYICPNPNDFWIYRQIYPCINLVRKSNHITFCRKGKNMNFLYWNRKYLSLWPISQLMYLLMEGEFILTTSRERTAHQPLL